MKITKLELVISELLGHLEKLSKKAKEFHGITAFAMKSDISLIQPFLQETAERKVPIKLLSGDYLFVTQSGAGNPIEPLVFVACDFNLDIQVIDLFKELHKKRTPRKEAVVLAYE